MVGVVLLALAGCAEGDPLHRGSTVACAPDGQPLQPVCTSSRDGDTVIVRQASGAFRRLVTTPAGLESADGMEPLKRLGQDVSIGGWTYRLAPVGR